MNKQTRITTRLPRNGYIRLKGARLPNLQKKITSLNKT